MSPNLSWSGTRGLPKVNLAFQVRLGVSRGAQGLCRTSTSPLGHAKAWCLAVVWIVKFQTTPGTGAMIRWRHRQPQQERFSSTQETGTRKHPCLSSARCAYRTPHQWPSSQHQECQNRLVRPKRNEIPQILHRTFFSRHFCHENRTT